MCCCYPKQSEKKLDAIRQQSHLVSKKIHGCVQGSGATIDKHQVQICLSAFMYVLSCAVLGVTSYVIYYI